MPSTLGPGGSRPVLGDRAAFWGIAAINALFLLAAAAPSPLYSTYAATFGFRPLVLTVVFAVYALGLLVGLLVTGRISDFVGRKPVVLAGIALEIVAMLMFVLADSTLALGSARLVQGVATGLVLGVLSAQIVEFAGPAGARLAPVVSGAAPLVGMAVGAVVSSSLVQYAPHPMRLVFWVIIAGLVVGFAFTLGVRETVDRRAGALGSLRPVVAIPPQSRPTFVKIAWPLIALWSLTGFYLSLSATLIGQIEQSTNKLWGGAALVTLMVPGFVSVVLGRDLTAWRAMVLGCAAFFVGVALTAAGVALSSGALFLVATVIAGAGFGTAFTGTLRAVLGVTPADQRAGTLASYFLLSYTSFSVPVLLAGLAEQRWSASAVGLVFLAGVAVLGGLGVLTSVPNLRAETADDAVRVAAGR